MNPLDGPSVDVNWSSNLFWWSYAGGTVATITKRYFNPYTGVYQYINLPPLINWQDALIPTINSSSKADRVTGIVNTVISPISSMIGDTLIIKGTYKYPITSKSNPNSFFVN